jgi:CMP-N-acetylneuraminic acid synthetase
MFEIERLQAVDIDEELDFKVAELLYKEVNQK